MARINARHFWLASCTGLALFQLAPRALAKTWLDYINLGQWSSNTRLRFECQGAEPYDELECRVTSYVVFKLGDSDDKRGWYRAQIEKVDAASKSDFAEIQRQFGGAPPSADEVARMARATPEQRAAWAGEHAISAAIRRAKTRSALKAALDKSFALGRATCDVVANESPPSIYRRVAPHCWEFHAGPSRVCHVSQLFRLENQPDNPAAWTYSESVEFADREGECSVWGDRVGKIEVYSTNMGYELAGCTHVTLGR